MPGNSIPTAWWILAVFLLIGVALVAYLWWMRFRIRNDESHEIAISRIGITDLGEGKAPPVTEFDHAFSPDTAASPDAAAMPPIPTARAGDFPPVLPPIAEASPPPFFIRDGLPTGLLAGNARAWLDLTVRPMRGGTNLTGAAVDYEIDIRNSGAVGATAIRLDIRLLSASADQDAILGTLFAAPIERPAVAPFEIAADEHVSLGGMAMLPTEALNLLSVGDREVFVPLLTINLVYGWDGGGRGQSASAHVIGIERPDDTKMAPFRTDIGPRMFDRVAARIHTLSVRR